MEHNTKYGVIFPGEIDKKAENTLKPKKKHCWRKRYFLSYFQKFRLNFRLPKSVSVFRSRSKELSEPFPYFSKALVNSALVPQVGRQKMKQGKESRKSPPHLMGGPVLPANCYRK